ncbi:MAG: hypothetical protein QOD41_2129, partial [Cryptosporangiaceae bacterium]|nr:hypothetical protein [Cryptosporangiaceae bacterium]
ETSRHASVVLPPPRLLQSPHYDVILGMRAIEKYARYSPAALPLPAGRPSEAEILARIVQIAAGEGAFADPDAVDERLIDVMIRGAQRRPGSPFAQRDPAELKALLTGATGIERRLDLMLRLGPFGDALGLRPSGLTLRALEQAPNGIGFGPLEPRLAEVLKTASGHVDLCPAPIAADVPRLAARLTAPPDEFVLIARRQLKSVNSWSHNVRSLAGGSNRCVALISATDAERLGIAAGDPVRIEGKHGTVVVPAEPTSDLMAGVVSMPYGWGHDRPGTRLSHASQDPGVSLNSLTDEYTLDPLSGTPVFNGLPIRLTRADPHVPSPPSAPASALTATSALAYPRPEDHPALP